MIVYTPFWKTVQKRGLSTYALIHKLGVANGTLYRMRKNKPINTETINRFCKILHCQPQDIIEYLEDDE